ncbi:hypothetical protein BIV57_01745 [Mangrovactinospora gilvigrisea]|uniref:Uncharacterized protein n=2 Tax=Mangrovactinospora gilvigrisea TaxID=1428644 RepID=A0A1J7CCH0_9ACTN|nr:hypothetical protein BIV57_01745 [Mangrovactinospora gilvigrisea]
MTKMAIGNGMDVEPGRVAEARQGAYTTTGVLFLLFAVIQLGWTVKGITDLKDHPGPKDYLLALGDPASGYARYFLGSPEDVALSLALLIVAFVAFAKRRAARGAAVALAFVTLFLEARGLVGLHNTMYRSIFLHSGTENMLRVATWGVGVLFSVIVLIVMLRASESSEMEAMGMSPGAAYGSSSGGYSDGPQTQW